MQVLLFRHTKQTGKNIADTAHKGGKNILHDHYLLGTCPRLGRQSRITYAGATIFVFARFLKDKISWYN